MSRLDPNDRRFGVRIYDVTTADDTKLLIVGVVAGGEEIAHLPGPWVSRLRVLLERVERDYPGRTGDAGGVSEIPGVEVWSGNGGGDPTLN